jgi:hypothetical protein
VSHRTANKLAPFALVGVLVVVAIVATHHGGGSASDAAQPAASPAATISQCQVGGKTVLTGIPADAQSFRFKFIGGGFTGHSWHTDWLPNDNQVQAGTYWVYTLGDYGTKPTGVTGEVQMSDGSTVETDLQVCY